MERLRSNEHLETPEISANSAEKIGSKLVEQIDEDDFNRKIQAKVRMKEELSHDDGSNERKEWKRLGMFLVNEKTMPQEVCRTLRANGIDIFEDETVLEIHLPPQKTSIGEIKASLARLCEYLESIKKDPKSPLYIYGVSYLAKFAARYGFKVAKLPRNVQENSGAARLINTYTKSEDPVKKKIAARYQTEDIQICYSSVDDLIETVRNDHYESQIHKYHTRRKIGDLLT